MYLSGRTQPLYPRYSILDALPAIKRLGFDGVEICLEIDEISPANLTAQSIAAIRAQVEALGLAPHVVGYHKDYIYDDALFELSKQAIRQTRAFGAGILIFSTAVTRTGDREEWQRLLERTRVLVSLAEDEGVILAQEAEPGFIVSATADLLRLFDAIPSDNLAANFDLGHAFLTDPDPLAAIRQVGPKIVHGHIENMHTGLHDHSLPQQGDMDLGAYLTALAEVGFTGALALDLYKYDYEAVAPEAVAFLRGKI
jgi:sugar phosphate isomerase/epimerase